MVITSYHTWMGSPWLLYHTWCGGGPHGYYIIRGEEGVPMVITSYQVLRNPFGYIIPGEEEVPMVII